jgi:hypothetical protein
VLLLLFLLVPASAPASTLYDVHFTEDTVGAAPSTDPLTQPFPRQHPTVVHGDVTVVDAAGPLGDQPIRFGIPPHTPPALTQNQIELDFDYFSHFSTQYEIQFELSVLSLSPPVAPYFQDSYFTLLLDTINGVRRLDFNHDGTISRYWFQVGSMTIGSYQMGQKLDVAVGVDLPANHWSIAVNGVTLYDANFGASSLLAMRLGPATTAFSGEAALDNIRVTAVPEPATAVLLVGGLGALAARRQRSNFRYFSRCGVSASSPRRRLRSFS